MIDGDDLRAAVASGALTEAQAARLSALAHSRRGVRDAMREIDEPFELFRGFNEIFIVTGLAILATGWFGTVITFGFLTDGFSKTPFVAFGLAGAAILWGLSEYFIRRRRMVAPAIALAILFAANALLSISGSTMTVAITPEAFARVVIWPFIGATVATLIHWVRFRVPFSLALVALGLFGAAMFASVIASGEVPENARELFLVSAGGPFAWITLALGLAVFATALRFDMSDPHRVTRRAANGFWLHLVAAPMLVNTVALSLLDTGGPLALTGLVLFLALVALIAIVIDRRSFLIAGTAYVVILVQSLFSDSLGSFSLVVLGLGVVLLLLGAFWDRIRATVLAPLSGILPLDRLPPSYPKA